MREVYITIYKGMPQGFLDFVYKQSFAGLDDMPILERGVWKIAVMLTSCSIIELFGQVCS